MMVSMVISSNLALSTACLPWLQHFDHWPQLFVQATNKVWNQSRGLSSNISVPQISPGVAGQHYINQVPVTKSSTEILHEICPITVIL